MQIAVRVERSKTAIKGLSREIGKTREPERHVMPLDVKVNVTILRKVLIA